MKIFAGMGENTLAVKLPFVLDQKLELYTRKDVLTLQLGAFKKSISLPYALASKKILGADLEEGWLKIRFEGEDIGKRKGRKRGRGGKAAGKAR
jgi:arsenite-transporting ATPase